MNLLLDTHTFLWWDTQKSKIPLHIFALEQLPVHHKDPFDRLLIAQTASENLICVSADPMFSQYSIPLLW